MNQTKYKAGCKIAYCVLLLLTVQVSQFALWHQATAGVGTCGRKNVLLVQPESFSFGPQ